MYTNHDVKSNSHSVRTRVNSGPILRPKRSGETALKIRWSKKKQDKGRGSQGPLDPWTPPRRANQGRKRGALLMPPGIKTGVCFPSKPYRWALSAGATRGCSCTPAGKSSPHKHHAPGIGGAEISRLLLEFAGDSSTPSSRWAMSRNFSAVILRPQRRSPWSGPGPFLSPC